MRSKLAWTILAGVLACSFLQGCGNSDDTKKNGVPLLPGDLQGTPGGNHPGGTGATAPPATK